VRIEVETVAKGDNFIGTLWFVSTNNGAALLDRGLGQVVPFSAKRSPHCNELLAAEQRAKNGKIGLWENYVEEVVVAGDDDEETQVVKGQMNVKVTEVADAVTFYLQDLDDPNIAKLDALMEEFNGNVPASAPEKLDKGVVYAGLYSDECWYRVRTEGMTSAGLMRVYFLDYGNHEQLATTNFRDLPAGAKNAPALAKPAILAGLRAPTKASEHFEGAAITFNDRAFDRTMTAKVECIDKSGKMHVTLTDPEDKEFTINQALLRGGWCRLEERPEWKLKGYVSELRKDEDEAKNARFNIWEYGDVSDEEEDDAKPNRFDGRTGKPITR
jgi:staphylococcal nuclease domain-containing protein 1